jgi:deoxyribose-phosphate aldolase
MPDPQLAHVLDFADHSAKATPDDIKKLCADVIKYGFHAAFVNPTYVTLAKETLAGKAPVGTVISFPLGGDTKALKMAAANNAVSQGADELDVVPNIGLYLAGNTNAFMTELQDIVESAHMTGAPVIVKFILDSGYFDKEADPKASLMRASEIVRAAGADFVKIGSGMGPRNPTLADLAAVKEAIGTSIKIKVAGGITDRKTAEAFFAAGANRIGTSHAIEIVSEKPATKKASKEE